MNTTLRKGWFLQLIPVAPPPTTPGLCLVGQIIDVVEGSEFTLTYPGPDDFWTNERFLFNESKADVVTRMHDQAVFRLGIVSSLFSGRSCFAKDIKSVVKGD